MSRKSKAGCQKTFPATVPVRQGSRLPGEFLPSPSWEVSKNTLEKPTHQGRLGQSQPCPGQEVTAGPSGLMHMVFRSAVDKAAGHFPAFQGPGQGLTAQRRSKASGHCGEGAWAPCRPGARGQPRSCSTKANLTSTPH